MIDPTTNIQSTPVTSTQNSALAGAASDFETFLKLLTAEIRHQDPLEPMDGTQFVSQLASFSAVEQQLETNSTLQNISAMLTANTAETEATWLGHTAEFRGELTVAEAPITGRFLDPASQASTIIVRGAAGQKLAEFTQPEGATNFTWTPPEDGSLTGRDVSFHRVTPDSQTGEEQALIKDKLVELRFSPAGISFVTASGHPLEKGDVYSLRYNEAQSGEDPDTE